VVAGLLGTVRHVHIGIDLAWNTRRRTGLAAVDDDGALVASGSAVSDEEIDDWLTALPAPVVNAAIDAPLVVVNATGMRDCERQVGRAYGRYGASCHASNRSIPYFDPPRAWSMAERHGWATDPSHRASVELPAAIEVYPHAAMVGLFGLGRILKYKSGPVTTRREALLELLDRMEGIAVLRLHENARWGEVRRAVEEATRPVHVDRVEDEVDAVMCAHLAWLWHRAPASLHVFGDADTGYIVAPPPPTHPATPRPVPAMPVPAVPVHRLDERVVVDVVGRPTAWAGGVRERAWKDAVRDALTPHRFPAPARLALEVEFRLGPDQRDWKEPDLDNLLKSTIDALDDVLGARPGAFRRQADDVRVDRITASKRPVRKGEKAGALITLRPSPNPW
jgi:predicted RNase H-like nuclease/Holliday junction resolvase RusA-like endonuclease